MNIPRVFVPLSKDPFNWFVSGKKTWELRRYGRQYTEKNIKKGRLVELRCGYSNRQKVIWGFIEEVYVFENLEDVISNIQYELIVPFAQSHIEAVQQIGKILGTDPSNKYIIFKIKEIKDPQFIEISSDYLEMIKNGQKKSTIRRGKRDYKLGLCILYTDKEILVVNITALKTKEMFQINDNEARTDGFQNLSGLRNALNKFYDNLQDNQIMTVVEFSLLGVNINGN